MILPLFQTAASKRSSSTQGYNRKRQEVVRPPVDMIAYRRPVEWKLNRQVDKYILFNSYLNTFFSSDAALFATSRYYFFENLKRLIQLQAINLFLQVNSCVEK